MATNINGALKNKSNDDAIQKKLEKMITVFSETTCLSIEALFGRNALVDKAWCSNKHIEIDSQYILMMGSASEKYQSILTLGVNNKCIVELTGQELEQSEFCDVFGELANTWFAVLMDRVDFTEQFGFLNQTVPILYTKGIPFLPFISGVNGSVAVNDEELLVGFAIKNK
ncbi:MAG: hypothetical protein JW915_07135 [Chitinispirillaceae bacterium]|nr:hypothetical protein [Chitinispirillaceae bacterium]